MSSYAPPTCDISWEQDYEDRMNPQLLTRLLRSSIPVLDHADWFVEVVDEGFCQTTLPLNEPTTNQHGTHQAALISLSADYTGGIALATLLRGVPLAGVHRCVEAESASLWLASMNVKYKSPSSGHLTGTCRVDQAKADSIRRRYFNGQRVLVTLEIEFSSNGQQVAIAEMKYFAQPTRTLTPQPDSKSRSTLFGHKLKASARMIAGIRARSSANACIASPCPLASVSAGPHGHLLADRLQKSLPQLTDMVQARSQHLDEMMDRGNFSQVVMLGAGLDMRSLKHAFKGPKTVFFELDLPEMIAERRRVVDQLPERHESQRVMIATDFRNESPSLALANSRRFEAHLPTLFIYEGCSMYFDAGQNERLLRDIHSLLQHSDSRIWLDLVSQQVAARQTPHPAIDAFLQAMEELGESFIFGVDHPEIWLRRTGLRTMEVVSCGDYLRDEDPIFSHYQFLTAGRILHQASISESIPKPLGLNKNFANHKDTGVAYP